MRQSMHKIGSITAGVKKPARVTTGSGGVTGAADALVIWVGFGNGFANMFGNLLLYISAGICAMLIQLNGVWTM